MISFEAGLLNYKYVTYKVDMLCSKVRHVYYVCVYAYVYVHMYAVKCVEMQPLKALTHGIRAINRI